MKPHKLTAAPSIESVSRLTEVSYPINRYRFYFCALEDLKFQDQAGSALRGALGHALMKLVCPSASLSQPTCTCEDGTLCTYRKLFRPSPHELPNGQVLTPPAPLVFEASCSGKHFAVGAVGFFDLVLTGDFANQHLELLRAAFGLALRTHIGGGRAQLTEVVLVDAPSDGVPNHSDSVLVQLITPLKLQHRGQLVTPADFSGEVFLRTLKRRYKILESLHGERSDQQRQVDHPEDFTVKTVHSLSSTSWTRWSNRQSHQIPVEALVGWIEFSELTDSAWHYLYYGQWLHVGKHSMFGLGQYRVWHTGS